MKKLSTAKKIIFFAVTALAIALAFIPPFEGLDAIGMRFLGLFIWWIVVMIIEVLPSHTTCILVLTLAVALGCAPTATAFGAFGSSTIWLMVGAFGIAAGLSTSGLLNRLSLGVMQMFPGTYQGQVFALALASLVCAPAIPSSAAKCAITFPLAGAVSDKMGYKPHSKGTIGFFTITNHITNMAGNMFLTGSLSIPIILAMCTDTFTWFGWLKIFFVWGLVVIGLTLIFVLVVYKPDKEDRVEIPKEELRKMFTDLGPMSKAEKGSLAVLVLTIALWMTESIHGIPTYAVSLLAWVALSALGLFSPADFMTKILWPVVAMVGGILGAITMLSSTGVASWISSLVAPVVNPFMNSPAILIIIVFFISVLLMFAMVQGPVTAALFVTLLSQTSLNPVVIAFVASLGAYVYILPFQFPGTITAMGVYGGRVEHKDIVKSAWAWEVINLIAFAASIPLWSLLGLL